MMKEGRPQHIIRQAVTFALPLFGALLVWRTMMLLSGSEEPIVVVLSGSMEPSYHRGDLVFLSMPEESFRVGDVVVYKIDGHEVPIIHRIVEVHQDKTRYLTKGDANNVTDRQIYPPGQEWIGKEHIIGKAYWFIPFIGRMTILASSYPLLRNALILVISFVAFFFERD